MTSNSGLTDPRPLADIGEHAPLLGQEPYSGLKIIHAGFFRTATASMAVAYRELGYSAHHGLDDVQGNPWTQLELAAEATWPGVPGSTPRPKFTRQDWNKIWAPFDVSTDLGSPFVPELIRIYPEAKVVIVKRDADKWWPSFKTELLDTLWHRTTPLINFIAWNIMGSRAPHAMMKIHLGFFDVKTREEIDSVAKQKYNEYYEYLLKTVPEEKRLVYKMGDGWEPLCKLLGKPVPDKPFPRVNDKAAHDKGAQERRAKIMNALYTKVIPPALCIGVLVVVLSMWYW